MRVPAVHTRESSHYSTGSTLMKFVFPGTCSGAPPVMTTFCPDSIYPALLAASREWRIMSSIVSDGGIEIGITPQLSERKSRTAVLGVVAMIGCLGRKRATRHAVDPDQVGVMIAAAFVSFAMK